MVSGGVFERHPKLRVAFLEAGAGWVPFFIDRLHDHYEKRGDWVQRGWRRDPHEYLAAGNIWVTCEPEEPILPGVIDVLGADFIMFASDYPGRRMAGEHQASAHPRRYQRGSPGEDRRLERATLLQPRTDLIGVPTGATGDRMAAWALLCCARH